VNSVTRVKAIALIRRGSAVLLSFAIDPDTGARYGRFLGGGVERGEQPAEAVRRELREEMGVELDGVIPLAVVENAYDHRGRRYHEIIHVFAAHLADTRLYERAAFPVKESVCDGPAEWVGTDVLLRGEIAVYPPELLRILERLESESTRTATPAV
jgi:ADP-ribose pyrophosphatase YjhB (NUDIX family)